MLRSSDEVGEAAVARGEAFVERLVAADVERIDVYTDRTTADCGHVGPIVSNLTGAQFSLHVTLAMRILLGGNDPAHCAVLEEAGFAVPEVTHVAERVRVFDGEEQERAFRSAPSAPGGGPTPRRQRGLGDRHSPGAPQQPFGWSDVERKARRVAEPAVGPRAVDRMVADVRSWGQDDVPVTETLPWTDLARSADAR